MPIDFPDMESLIARAKARKFRAPNPDESEDQYRNSFADFMLGIDSVEASEIRTGKGWDLQTPQELLAELPGMLELVESLRKTYIPRD